MSCSSISIEAVLSQTPNHALVSLSELWTIMKIAWRERYPCLHAFHPQGKRYEFFCVSGLTHVRIVHPEANTRQLSRTETFYKSLWSALTVQWCVDLWLIRYLLCCCPTHRLLRVNFARGQIKGSRCFFRIAALGRREVACRSEAACLLTGHNIRFSLLRSFDTLWHNHTYNLFIYL